VDLPISMMDLDPEKIGEALIRLAVASHGMGHQRLSSSARDYMVPHADDGMSPEARFVVALFCYPARKVLVESEAHDALSYFGERLLGEPEAARTP
jgi:hypothetical protein